jgi:glycyl-tRNA synthetase
MAEIEHFVDPKDKSHPKFKKVTNFKLPLISAQDQVDMKQHSWV